MNNTAKNILYSFILLALAGAVYLYRSQFGTQYVYIQGVTMGSSKFNIKYMAEGGVSYEKEINELLKGFNQSLSTYIPDSEITRFNKSDTLVYDSPFFYPILRRSQEIHTLTQGAFDPTVMPLVRAWGFGPSPIPDEQLPARVVDSLRTLVDFASLRFDEKMVYKTKKGVELDFSAIAGGYAVDLVAKLLDEKGIEHYMIEISGEVITKGKNKDGQTWTIGIENPLYGERGGDQLTAKIRLDGRAMATSGNYRNFYVLDGKKYAHTISPQTGHPVDHNLLSASVFTKDCMSADALATACMVAGVDKAIQMAKTNGFDLFLIYEEANELKVYMSEGVKSYLVN